MLEVGVPSIEEPRRIFHAISLSISLRRDGAPPGQLHHALLSSSMPYRIDPRLVMVLSRKYYFDAAVWMMSIIAAGKITYKMPYPRGTWGNFCFMARIMAMSFAILVFAGPVDEPIFASPTV